MRDMYAGIFTLWTVRGCTCASRCSGEFEIERFSYAYHYQRADGTFVFRYDNTAHFPELENFPHHQLCLMC